MSASLAESPRMSQKAKSLVDGEFHFTSEDFQRISKILYQDSGISLTDAKTALVYSRLAKRLRVLGMENFRDYCELVSGNEGVDERQAMLAALTTNVTRFFREGHHFDHVRDALLPDHIDRIRAGGRLRMWSAACSSGQEPYSMAMAILAAMPDALNHDIKILASDIDPNMVRAAKQGIYTEESLDAVPVDLRRAWFTRADEPRKWRAKPELQSLISFRELNLIADWPMKGQFEAVFCRNVVIYFDEPTQERIWSRFASQMTDNACLYIGHSERVTGPAASLFVTDGMTTYRKKAPR